MTSYRGDARGSLERAQNELGTGDDARLKYAALELRMAMEALTYDRLKAYKKEFPPKEYATWQPIKVMQLLLDIDIDADRETTISVGREETYGEPAKVMRVVGTDKPLSLRALKEHYNALGNYLHIPTLSQIEKESGDRNVKLRERCEAISHHIASRLATHIHNSTFGNFATLKCMECGKPVRKRMPRGADSIEATCYECHASYTLTATSDNRVNWELHQEEVACGNETCDQKIIILRKDIKQGTYWNCNKCKGENSISLGVNFTPTDVDEP